jgi:transcriptional regulator with XRE-family HTH domain
MFVFLIQTRPQLIDQIRTVMQQTPSKIFCEMMRKERVRQGLSSAAVAELIGLHGYEIDAWEALIRAPRIGTAIKWARVLGYELDLRRASD